jgi:anaerobic ribonucleoside-triphosphate reductase activating protein
VEFHDANGGVAVSVAELLSRIEAAGVIDGISLSGGEPFDQAEPLAELCRRARERELTVLCFTGYRLTELRGKHAAAALLAQVDLLVAGPYREDEPCEEPLRASANQELHFLTGRIAPDELRELPRAEVLIRDGEVRVSGFEAELSQQLRLALEPEAPDDA